MRASHSSLLKPKVKRHEILVPRDVAPTLQTAVKKTVALLLAHSKISIIPHVQNTSRNNVRNEREFPIEMLAMKDYIFDVGREFQNGASFYKASFLVESSEKLSKIKKTRILEILKTKKIFIQEFESDEVYDSSEVGFLCNLHPTFTARKQVIRELRKYVEEIMGEEIRMKLKLTNRFYGSNNEGSIRSQYLALYIDTVHHKNAARIIGQGLENGKLLKRWKSVKLLPTRPTLHESYDKEKFMKVLQIHNKAIRDTTRVAIKNMWVGDYKLVRNEQLAYALNIENKSYTFRELIFAAADSQKIDINDFYVSGSHAYITCKNHKYTKTSDFVDILIDICKQKYGATEFAQQMRCVDPLDEKRHPQRVARPVYTTTNALDEMIQNVGPGIKLVKNRESTAKTYTSFKQGKSWKQIVVSPSNQESNTSPLTSDTNSKIRNLYDEVNNLRVIMNEERKKNKR